MTASEELARALRAVSVAREVERLAEGSTGPRAGERRAKRHQLIEVTDARVLAAARAGATTAQLAEALGLDATTARKRRARATLVAGNEVVAEPEPARTPPVVWVDVHRCGRPAPPPWPVSRRCGLDVGHEGDHDYDR